MTKAGPVTITRVDGTTETREPYTPSQELAAQRGKSPGKKPRKPRKRTAAELYPNHAAHLAEWEAVLNLAGPILQGKARSHASRTIHTEELEPFAADGCLRAFLQWRQRNTGPAIVHGRLNARLRSWIATEADRDVGHGVRQLERGRLPDRLRSPVEEIPDKPDGFSWLDRWADWEEMLKATKAIPDRIDRILIQGAYSVVHHPGEFKSLGLGEPEGLPSFAHKSERWLVEWFLIFMFSVRVASMSARWRSIRVSGVHTDGWITIEFRPPAGSSPARDGGGRGWTGTPEQSRHRRDSVPCAICDPFAAELRSTLKHWVRRKSEKVAERGA